MNLIRKGLSRVLLVLLFVLDLLRLLLGSIRRTALVRLASVITLVGSVGTTARVSIAATPGPEGLAALRAGEVRHGFTAQASFLGPSGNVVGARFEHTTGVVVDLLFFASVPQVSISVPSIPVSDSGEPHALEHLVVSRGLSGTYLQMLLSMRMAIGTARTDRDRTFYQFRTSAGRGAFYELLSQHLSTLVEPDFTDEDVRREVAHPEVAAAADGGLALSMKGGVYNEMIASMARPRYRQPRILKKMIFGEDHALSLNGGGDPRLLWQLSPEAIRAFHRSNYSIGPGLELVVAVPLAWSADEVLERLHADFERLAPAGRASGPARLTQFRPAPSGEIRIATYPSRQSDAPQDVLLGWRTLPELSSDEWDSLEVLLRMVAGGGGSYLHEDLVDQETRYVDSGVTNIGVDIEYVTAAYPYVILRGLPATSVKRPLLELIQAAALKRFRWIAEMPDGSRELSDVAQRAHSRVAAARREHLRFLDSPPNFGERGADRRWHDRLGRLARSAEFHQPVAPLSLYGRLERDLDAGRNPWRDLLAHTGLSQPPYVVGLLPDTRLAERERTEAVAQLKRRELELAERLGNGDVQKALAFLRVQQQEAAAKIDERDRAVPKPRFVAEPPLTLDDAPFEQSALAKVVPLVRVHFETTPFTDLGLAFDLSAVPPDDWILLPLLERALSGAGVTTRGGDALNHLQARDRRERETFGLSIAPVGNPATGRHELEVSASASSPEEIAPAVEWMENHMLRPRFDSEARARLVDLCKDAIQSYRGLIDTSETIWATDLAMAFRYQDDPLHLVLSSPFTRLRMLTRLRWQLEDPPLEVRRQIEAQLNGLDVLLAAVAARERVVKHLDSVEGELGETLRYELSMLPGERWREDLAEVARDLRSDLAVGSSRVMADLDGLRKRVFVRGGARARITANSAHADAAAILLEALLRKLPDSGVRSRCGRRPSPVRARLEQRYGRLGQAVHVGFVRPGAQSGVYVLTAEGPEYASRSPEAALDLLAVGVFSGTGPQTFYAKILGAGLAYSAGIVVRTRQGIILNYADRCPDLVQAMKFAGDLARREVFDDPFLLEYSLADAFADYRGGNDFSSRGATLAANLADGITPAKVEGFKRVLLEVARGKGAVARVAERVSDAVGRVVVGYGRKVNESPRALGFVIGPEDLLASYEAFLAEEGEAERLIRVFPRDFWPLAKERGAANGRPRVHAREGTERTLDAGGSTSAPHCMRPTASDLCPVTNGRPRRLPREVTRDLFNGCSMATEGGGGARNVEGRRQVPSDPCPGSRRMRDDGLLGAER